MGKFNSEMDTLNKELSGNSTVEIHSIWNQKFTGWAWQKKEPMNLKTDQWKLSKLKERGKRKRKRKKPWNIYDLFGNIEWPNIHGATILEGEEIIGQKKNQVLMAKMEERLQITEIKNLIQSK